MSPHHEVETTFAPAPDAAIPDLTVLDQVDEVRDAGTVVLSAVYHDTSDLRLVRAGVSLRRRSGGEDEGWHLKVPAATGRDEYVRPLDDASTPPASLTRLALGWTRGAGLAPIATITTERRRLHLLGHEGDVLAELADDRVTTERLAWREWEVELVHGDADLLAAVERVFDEHGVRPAEVSRKIERALGDAVPAPLRIRRPKPGRPVALLVHCRLADQVDALARHDVGARAGHDESVHQVRVAARRLGALLGTFRPVFDRAATDPVRAELHWLAGALGTARDGAVVHARLRALLDEEPEERVHGPVLERLRSTYTDRGKGELHDVLGSTRYLALRGRLDALVADPPWTAEADAAARDVVPDLLRAEVRRFRKRLRAAAREGEPSFTYGVLLAREEARAARLEADYWAWDTLDMLKSGTRRAGMAVREK